MDQEPKNDVSSILRGIFEVTQRSSVPTGAQIPALPPPSAFDAQIQPVQLPDGKRRDIITFRQRGGDAIVKIPAVIEDRFQVQDIFSASGGFGVILRARDNRLSNRTCLIKATRYDKLTLDRASEGDAESLLHRRSSTQSECRALLEMQKRNEGRVPNLLYMAVDFLPSLLERWKGGDEALLFEEPFVVIQYIPGKTLKQVIEGAVALNRLSDRRWWQAVVRWTRELSSILNAMHSPWEKKLPSGETVVRGYLYQDLKPDNCIVSNEEFLTLIDFGGVREFHVLRGGSRRLYGESVFTPGYVAPEVVADPDTADVRSDLYMVGALLWTMLTGVSATKLADVKTLSPVLDPQDTRLPGSLPGSVREVLRLALARDPEQRFGNALELKDAATEALKDLARGAR